MLQSQIQELQAVTRPGENWKPVPGYEGYVECSDQCRFYSYTRTTKKNNTIWGRILPQHLNRRLGYFSFHLPSVSGKKRVTKAAHKIFMDTWRPNPDPEHLTDINHIDGIKTNNDFHNLERCTHQQNVAHAHRVGLRQYKLGASGYIGIFKIKDRDLKRPYVGHINQKGKVKSVPGLFANVLEAAQNRDIYIMENNLNNRRNFSWVN